MLSVAYLASGGSMITPEAISVVENSQADPGIEPGTWPTGCSQSKLLTLERHPYQGVVRCYALPTR